MITVGVTGAIGSGKTAFCKVFDQLGAKVFYADEEAKKLMVRDKSLQEQLITAFGDETYHNDGSLNKSHLIHEAFRKGRVEELNSIVHPAVAKEFRREAEKAIKEGTTIFVKEAALLLNNGRPDDLDFIIIIKSDPNTRISRVVKRDHTTKDSVEERDSKQPDFDKLKHTADYVIENNGTLDELENKATILFYELINKSNKKRSK